MLDRAERARTNYFVQGMDEIDKWSKEVDRQAQAAPSMALASDVYAKEIGRQVPLVGSFINAYDAYQETGEWSPDAVEALFEGLGEIGAFVGLAKISNRFGDLTAERSVSPPATIGGEAGVCSTETVATRRFLGNIPADVTVRGATAEVQLGFVVEMNAAEIQAMREFAVGNGATRAVVRTGEMYNAELAANLAERARMSRTILGGVIADLTENGVSEFEITFEDLLGN